MTEEKSPSLNVLRDLFRKGEFQQVRGGLEVYLAAIPEDTDTERVEKKQALALKYHLDNLDTLRQIHRAVLKQDWDQAISQVQAATEMGLTWDIELYPLTELLDGLRERQIQAADRKAQSLLRQAEEAEANQEPDRARDLYAQATAVPHLSPQQRAQIQRRLNAPRADAPETLSTIATFMQPDALMKQLVGTILKKSRPQLAEAIRLCAVPFWFDLEVLSALRASDDGLDEKILQRMTRFSFVQEDDREHFTFNQDVRYYLLSEWAQDPEGLLEANRRAQSYFLQKLEATAPDNVLADALVRTGQVTLTGTLTTISPEIGELTQNYLYHTLAVDGDAGIVLLRRLFHAAGEAHHLALAERYLEIANEQRVRLNPDQRAHIDYMRGLLNQLQERWDASRDLFERMLDRGGLPATLQARVRRALGETLVQQEQWVEAIELFELALEDFQADDDTLESALTMICLGKAHLDMALKTWGGGETFGLGQSWLDKIQDMVTSIGRLPIIVFLMCNLGIRALLPVILRVGRDMDWPIARLFATAAQWFNRADVLLHQLNDAEGLGHVEESLAWLYLSLGHPSRAEALYHRLLTREGTTVGEYRAARARLCLAQALMHQGQLDQAQELLEQILPIFVTYQHTERIAQAHTTLAQTFALEEQSDQAVSHYQQAAQLYHQLEDDANATEVIEQMRLLRDRPQTGEAIREAIDQTASQITRRRYLTRFDLPLLHIFRMIALIGLVGVLFFGLFTSVDIESGTDFGVSEALLSNQQDMAPPSNPTIGLTVTPQLRLSSEVNFAVRLIIVIIAVYLLLYTVFGLWLTVRTPLSSLQEAQSLDIIVDPHGVSRGVDGLPGSSRIKWGQVTAILLSDRGLFRKPIPSFSRFGLFNEQEAVIIDWQTRRSFAARAFIQEHLGPSKGKRDAPSKQSIPTYKFGFSVFHSHSGQLFVGTLVFILAFILIAQVEQQVLTTHLGPLPYSLADLYGISYIGLLIPLGWWLAVQPLRERLFLKPETLYVWLVGIVGLLLSTFIVLDLGLGWLRLPIGRPNVAVGLLAAFLVGGATYYVLTTRRWRQRPFRRGDHVYGLPVRLILGTVALIVIVLTLGLVVRETAAYHYLALANFNQQKATEAQDSTQAQELYEKAFAFYDQTLEWTGDDADTYHSQGAMLNQLGRYAEAVESIQKAININPDKLAYYESLSTTYASWAADRQKADDQERARELYALARDSYSLVLEKSSQDATDLSTTYALRAGVYSQIGEDYAQKVGEAEAAGNLDLAADNRRAAIENYRAAYTDYDQALKLEPNSATALSGRGWMVYRLAKYENDPEQRRSDLESALADLEQATAIDPGQVSAWTGQGYTHFALGELYVWSDQVQGRTRSACAESERNPNTVQDRLIYREENLKAIEAFEQATALTPDNAGLYSVQGFIRYNLLNCPEMDNETLFLAIIEDFDQALALEPDVLEWRLRRANIYYALGPDYYPQAIVDYEVLVALQPDAGWYLTLGNLYFVEGDTDKAVEAYMQAIEISEPEAVSGGYVGIEILNRVVETRPDWALAYYNRGYQYLQQGDNQKASADLRRAAEIDPDHYSSQALLGWLNYLDGDYGLSAEASGIAVALDPTEPRAYFNQGLALVAAGDAQQAARVYEAGIAATNALTTEQIALQYYDEALNDLSNVPQDPEGIADVLRARLTFQKALIYVRSGYADEARSTYEAGITIAEALTDREAQRALYDEAIDDLRAADTALIEEITEFITLIESARDS